VTVTTLEPLRAGDRLVIASHNPGKVRELAELIAPFGLDAVPAAEFDIGEPDETGATFEENAAIKAVAASLATGLPALADDSGLAVDALGGEPGVYSARWAGPDKDFRRAMRLVEEKLQAAGATKPDSRRGRFVAVLCLASPDGKTRSWRGEVEGELVWPPRGDMGFGYDPMFRPEGQERTFGQMSAEEKHGWRPGAAPLSHRARAFAAFARDLQIGGAA
jgi:XTP/dITP diphosphohydrolase